MNRIALTCGTFKILCIKNSIPLLKLHISHFFTPLWTPNLLDFRYWVIFCFNLHPRNFLRNLISSCLKCTFVIFLPVCVYSSNQKEIFQYFIYLSFYHFGVCSIHWKTAFPKFAVIHNSPVPSSYQATEIIYWLLRKFDAVEYTFKFYSKSKYFVWTS